MKSFKAKSLSLLRTVTQFTIHTWFRGLSDWSQDHKTLVWLACIGRQYFWNAIGIVLSKLVLVPIENMNAESSTFAGLPSLSGVSEVRYERYSFVKSVKLHHICSCFHISQASSILINWEYNTCSHPFKRPFKYRHTRLVWGILCIVWGYVVPGSCYK